MGNILRRIVFILLLLVGNAIDVNAQDAKSLSKEGWIVEPGTKPIVEQVNQVFKAKQDTTMIVAQGCYVSDTYNDAYCMAYLNALQDVAKQTHCMMLSRNVDNTSTKDTENFLLTEEYDISILVKHEMDTKDCADKWNIISMVKVDGYNLENKADNRIERQWNDIFNIENIKVIQSLYRLDKNGRIEVRLSLVVPRKELIIDIW